MTFIDWDPLARAGLFGGIFLAALFAVLWVWYDSSGSTNEDRWTWRIATTFFVLPTLPAVVLGAANLDSSRETLLNVFAWLAIGSGALALLSVLAYAAWGRVAAATFEPVHSPDAPTDYMPTRTPPIPEPATVPQTKPAAPQKPADAYFFVKAGPDQGKQFPVYGSVVIGRSDRCGIVLDDRRISAEHAQVKLNGGHFVFTDLESTNGSFLLVEGRDEQIRRAQPLVDGDRLRLGQTVLEFVDTRDGRR